jgi:glycosyltransferase involved in cell wall biosynthesis
MSRSLKLGLAERAAAADIFHTNGLWTMPNVYPAYFAREGGPVFVLSPRGMLNAAALKFSARSKRLFWVMLQLRAVRKASMLHATSEQEFEDIRSCGLMQPVVILPNGVEVPELNSRQKDSVPTVLYLGRLHPIKGIEILIQAWARLEGKFPSWRLVIRGPGNRDYVDQLRQKAQSLGLLRCEIGDGLYGNDKLQAFRSASLYVLPSESENFAMTVAESLAAGTPTIVTKGAPWRGLEEHGCGWWIDHGAEPLTCAMGTAMTMPNRELRLKGIRGREWMQRDFSWDAIGRDMATAYRWSREGGDRPIFVHV